MSIVYNYNRLRDLMYTPNRIVSIVVDQRYKVIAVD